jgi:two-component system, LytTR family, response regulator
MELMRILLVDDEPLARQGLRRRLAQAPDVTVIAECGNGKQAIAAIQRETPDLVFLDIQMPKLSRFEVLEAVGAAHMPYVIFVTAYDEYALRAFEVHALDYCLNRLMACASWPRSTVRANCCAAQPQPPSMNNCVDCSPTSARANNI